MNNILKFNEMDMVSEGLDLSSIFDSDKIKEFKKKILEWLNKDEPMLDFNSPEGKQKREELSKNIQGTISKIVDVLHSNVTKIVKSKTINKILGLSVFGSVIAAAWSLFFGGHTSFWNPLGNVEASIEWFQWAGLLYILKILQGIVSGTSGISSTLRSIWDWCKGLFKSDESIKIKKFEQFNYSSK